jgi:hypothetical protein
MSVVCRKRSYELVKTAVTVCLFICLHIAMCLPIHHASTACSRPSQMLKLGKLLNAWFMFSIRGTVAVCPSEWTCHPVGKGLGRTGVTPDPMRDHNCMTVSHIAPLLIISCLRHGRLTRIFTLVHPRWFGRFVNSPQPDRTSWRQFRRGWTGVSITSF